MDMIEAMARAICQTDCEGREMSEEDTARQVANGWDLWVPEAQAAIEAAEPFIQARIDEAVKAAMATAGWLPISDAPRDGSAFQAIIPGNGADNILCWSNGFLNSDGDECGTWTFDSDQEPPDDWTDGCCWEVNEGGGPSTQPTFWKAIRARGEG